MSYLLWKCYLEDDVEAFAKLLGNGHRKSPALARAELNSRDHAGMTILHRAVSSTGSKATIFASALLENPSVDLYIQDLENGWTALHRALYFGNITLARAILQRDLNDSTSPGSSTPITRVNALIKIKDREGNSAFDLYNATIARRILPPRSQSPPVDRSDDDDDDSIPLETDENESSFNASVDADELFAFGSNKNLTLGFGDEDDRQHPEKISLKRPEHLLFRFHHEHLLSRSDERDFSTRSPKFTATSVSDLPTLIKNRPIVIKDVALSKLHSAVLTTDPESNLYICGFGPGGRLGTGDDTTRFTYACIEGGALAGKKIIAVALGQNHTIAVSSNGEIFTWGTNTWGQLGYSLPQPGSQDEEPTNSSPRQIFGPLKREYIRGVAASAIHSVAFTSTSLFTWGKNDGQLGLMDSDSRSLESQTVPRRVAASLFPSPIQMVSAINRATICLLTNHSIYVFTNYGYNNVKFPVQNGFNNYHFNHTPLRHNGFSNNHLNHTPLQAYNNVKSPIHNGFSNDHLNHTPLRARHASGPRRISSITSGGDTIAAISSRGDLFTLSVNQNVDSSLAATSTTNPSKIRNALSQPQCVWSLRKGHWDGIKSVGVAENGSVIICTQGGAVWRRIRRPKIKDTQDSGYNYSKSKDYKFQRVPGLTNVIAVRSSIFGTYAALRKDCDITRNQIFIKPQKISSDLAPLFPIGDFQPSRPSLDDIEPNFWEPGLNKEHLDPFIRAVLASADLEADILRHIREKSLKNGEYNVKIFTNLSNTGIPVHGFILAARSPLIMEALSCFRKSGEPSQTELLTLTGNSNPEIIFHGVDFLTIVNLVLYIYTDRVADVWHFTRHSPKSAFRYRQVRIELIKLASRLGMSKLETAARLMASPEACLNEDLNSAFDKPGFFVDGDTVIELENGEMIVHSALLRQRCPFFGGLFNGRAGGNWLAGRRAVESERIRIDMKHINISTFELLLRYLYADVSTELFDDILSSDIDEFCDVILDVASAANELMLDRLSQICQQVIGRFVNTRNVCQLINTMAPCSVTELKDTGLEYLCLQLEAMLENHLLYELDEELMLELDKVVRANQAACLPFARSGKAEFLLHQRHPTLAGHINEERQRRIRDMAFRASIKDDDSRFSSSWRTLDDMTSPSQDKLSRKLTASRNAPFSPAILPKDSSADLMFDMDDEDPLLLVKSTCIKQRPIDWTMGLARNSSTLTPSKVAWQSTAIRMNPTIEKPPLSIPASSGTEINLSPITREASSKNTSSATLDTPWSSAVLPSPKLEMREIMAQASRDHTSTLPIKSSAERAKAETANKTAVISKLSQKERKKQQQALQQAATQPPSSVEIPSSTAAPSSPWQLPSSGSKVSLKDVLDIGTKNSPPAASLKASNYSMPTLNQVRRQTASPDTKFAGQRRAISSSSLNQASRANVPNPSARQQSWQIPTSVPTHLHTKPIPQAEPSLQLSMADIIGQQRREQDLIKEAVAKRSLQEIQEEQAFQEWWDQESRRAQEEEALRIESGVGSGGGGGRGKSGKRGRGRGRGRWSSSGLTPGQGSPAL